MKIFIFSKPFDYHIKLEEKLLEAQIDFTNVFHINQLLKFANYTTLDKIIVDLKVLKNQEELDALKSAFPLVDLILLRKENQISSLKQDGLTEKEIIPYLDSYIKNEQLKEKNRNNNFLLIKISNKYKKILKSEIDFISSEGKYSEIFISNRKYSMRISLKAIMDLLPVNFIRVHASYIVNTDKIESINTLTQKIEIQNQESLSYSRKYKSDLFSRFSVI